ncbi:MAG: MATE family efflux transporter, partial [Spirochaetes bacterium]|nr:MATE family efflux transporter [Spirochaetota bacterium]
MKNIQKNHSSLISGSIGRLLTRLTMPMIGGILAMVMFNLVDTIFVGRLGRDELAAMGFIYPVVLVIGSIALGMGIGASSVISRAIGEGNLQKVRRLTTDSLLLAFLLVAVFAVTGFFTIKPLFRAMGASGVILEHIRSYMSIWYAGVLFVIVPMVGNNAIRATGDTKTPSLIMMTAVGVNILFDPLLIFGMGPFPRMGIAGAALATVFARAITFLVALYVLYKRDKLITLKIPGLDELWRSWKSLLYIGIPAAGANIIQPLSIGVITRILSVFGPGIVAAFGAVSRVEMFSLTVIMALATALNPFIGQNYGAKKRDRVRQGIKLSIRFTLYWGLFLTILFIF